MGGTVRKEPLDPIWAPELPAVSCHREACVFLSIWVGPGISTGLTLGVKGSSHPDEQSEVREAGATVKPVGRQRRGHAEAISREEERHQLLR